MVRGTKASANFVDDEGNQRVGVGVILYKGGRPIGRFVTERRG